MSNSELTNLKSYLKQLRDEDLIWALYVFNHPNTYGNDRTRKHDTEDDIVDLNSIDKIQSIRDLIINEMDNKHEDDIYYFLKDLKNFKSKINHSSFDFNKIKDNERFLILACHIMEIKLNNREVLNIKNLYFKFLYMAYTFPIFYEEPREIKIIFNRFDKIYSKFNSHFKPDTSDFFVWAKKYINENSEFRRYKLDATDESEYETLINSIFDIIYYEDETIHYALRKKLSNAWYQKKHREEQKVKKHHYYALTKRAKEALHTLAFKYGITEDKMIEKLVNETYTKECCSVDGENQYL